jgi:hypothetical protein
MISKYRQRLLRERANAGCEMLAFILEKWRKHYPYWDNKSFEIWHNLLKDADKLASEWDREYKEAIGLLPPRDKPNDQS